MVQLEPLDVLTDLLDDVERDPIERRHVGGPRLGRDSEADPLGDGIDQQVRRRVRGQPANRGKRLAEVLLDVIGGQVADFISITHLLHLVRRHHLGFLTASRTVRVTREVKNGRRRPHHPG